MNKKDLEDFRSYLRSISDDQLGDSFVKFDIVAGEKSEVLVIGETNFRAEMRMDFTDLESCQKKLENFVQLKYMAMDTGAIQPPKPKKNEVDG